MHFTEAQNCSMKLRHVDFRRTTIPVGFARTDGLWPRFQPNRRVINECNVNCMHYCGYLGGRGQGFSRLSPEPLNRFGWTLIFFKLCPLCEVLGKFDSGPTTGAILGEGKRLSFFCPSVTYRIGYFQHCYTCAFDVKKSGSALGRIVSWPNLNFRSLRG